MPKNLEEEFEGFDNGTGNWADQFTEENGYKRYILFENSGELFDTQADCCRKVSVPSARLSACLNGKATRYKNMRFRYVYKRESGKS